jgi:hypothetical protein
VVGRPEISSEIEDRQGSCFLVWAKMSKSAATPLELLDEKVDRLLTELRLVRQHLGTVDDQMMVQGAVLQRLEQRQNEPLAAIHQQLVRLDRRLRALENK